MNCETCHLKELTMIDTVIPSGPRVYLSVAGGANPNLDISNTTAYFFGVPELEPLEIKDVLRCILHTIFFHRTLTLVRPKDVDCDIFEITYVQCGLADLEKEVDEKINHFIAWTDKHPNRRSQVCLSFFDEKNKQPGWFSNKTERIYWEQWFINLHVVSPKGHGKSHSSKVQSSIKGQALEETSSRRDALGLLIQEVMFQIINYANEKKDHIPAISDRIFNHEISIPSSSDSVFGWNADVLRRALSSGHSYSLN